MGVVGSVNQYGHLMATHVRSISRCANGQCCRAFDISFTLSMNAFIVQLRKGTFFCRKYVFKYSFSFCSRWHPSARKGPYSLRPSLCSLPKVALECPSLSGWTQIVPDLGIRMSAYSLFPSGDQRLFMFRKFLKPLSIFALPSCSLAVISAVLVSHSL